MLCLLTMENKKENVKKKVRFMEDVKQPSEAGIMCTIIGVTFFSFMKNTWIGDSSAMCHITNTNDDTSLFDIIDINESIQGFSGIMFATKKGKLHVNVCQVDRTKWVHTIWPIKFCPNAGANLFSLTCKLLQEKQFQATTKTTS